MYIIRRLAEIIGEILVSCIGAVVYTAGASERTGNQTSAAFTL